MILTKYKFELTSSLARMLKNQEQIDSVQESMQFARRYLNVLAGRLEKDLEEKIKEDENTINYDSPNWALKQAERLGYRRALRKVLDLIGPIKE